MIAVLIVLAVVGWGIAISCAVWAHRCQEGWRRALKGWSDALDGNDELLAFNAEMLNELKKFGISQSLGVDRPSSS